MKYDRMHHAKRPYRQITPELIPEQQPCNAKLKMQIKDFLKNREKNTWGGLGDGFVITKKSR